MVQTRARLLSAFKAGGVPKHLFGSLALHAEKSNVRQPCPVQPRGLMPGPAMPAIVVVVGRPAANAVRFTMRDITVIANSSRGAAAVGGRMTPMRY
jgi:hypothetical protein